MYFPTVFCNFILITFAIPGISFLFIWTWFRLTEVDCFTVTTVNFINDIIFIFCSYRIFRFVSLSKYEYMSIWDMSICSSFLLVPSTYSRFIFITISSSWISVACIWYCDWGQLWLLVILLKILRIRLSWYPFSFNTCFILAFYLYKSSLYVIMEYALLIKEETTFPLNLFGGESCSAGNGQYG